MDIVKTNYSSRERKIVEIAIKNDLKESFSPVGKSGCIINDYSIDLSPSIDLSLTDREIEVLASFAIGLTQYEVSKKLNISSNTVGFHLKNIDNKLSTNKTIVPILIAIKCGYLVLSKNDREHISH